MKNVMNMKAITLNDHTRIPSKYWALHRLQENFEVCLLNKYINKSAYRPSNGKSFNCSGDELTT